MTDKSRLHSFRLTEEDSKHIDEISKHLSKTKPDEDWTRSSTIRFLIRQGRKSLK